MMRCGRGAYLQMILDSRSISEESSLRGMVLVLVLREAKMETVDVSRRPRKTPLKLSRLIKTRRLRTSATVNDDKLL